MSFITAATTAAEAAPAGGAAVGEIIIATTGAVVLTTVLLVLGLGHRTGRISVLGRLGDVASRHMGLPAWVALPTVLSTASLITALFGMLWDISLHIDNGRDEGPLANPAHYFILLGLFGIFAAGVLALVLPKEKPSRAAVKITRDWYAPVGGVVFLFTSSFALMGFPLDDVWHRLFGQDVTLWGPTHLMLIGGAGFTLLGQAILLVEGRSSQTAPAEGEPTRMERLQQRIQRFRYAMAGGGLLIGLSVFQAEFDFGVPQFRLLFHPVLLAFAAGVGLVFARMYGGRGAALFAVGFFVAVRGIMAVLVGPVLGQTTPMFPLYLVSALVVEAVALKVDPRQAYRFGALAGLGVGTIGFLGEYAWTQVAFPIAWPDRILVEGALLVPLTGVAAGLLGAFAGSILGGAKAGRVPEVPRLAPAVAALAAIAIVVGYGLDTPARQGMTAQITLDEVTGAPERTANATIRITPASAAQDADWVTMTAWQGKGFHLDHLEQVAPGVWRTTEPAPISGTWKTVVRVHKGDALMGAPVFLPDDPAIPAAEVPARPEMTRAFIEDHKILQREVKGDVSQGLWTVGYAIVGLIALSLVLALGWGLVRLARALGAAPPEPPAPSAGREARVTRTPGTPTGAPA